MRVMIKGGIWKNTEDEILKAAVMKYGLNQWSRIATLLSRKSAKQCKARWEEWLNPAIKKTEWTKEEDEKLLHLSKILPCQWRTIAPIVGRSATQCLERYEKLLDDAMRADGAAPETDDPRKLRPGEIDPCPESKPSRPDPIDMDEDEKEMLNEARARLANTNGKKAKRKVREKMLDEARRLATLQKRRELKAAGIGGDYKRRVKGIDYNAEIPFHHKAPAGFYEPELDSSDKPDFLKMNRDQMDLKRQSDEKEAARKSDEAKLRARKKADLPSVVMSVNDIHDPFAARKRTKLDMPAPVLSDRDLEDIARTGMVANQLPVDASAPSATNTLLGTYSASPAPTTPMRTPRTPLLGDTVLEEARRIARFNAASAPLKGGDTVEVPDFGGGITPQRKVAATPSALITTGTPLRGSVAGTPSRGGSVAAGLTPLRDNLSINGDAASVSSEISERQRLAAVRAQLRSAFAQLPAPKNEVQIVGPDGDDEAEGADHAGADHVLDREDVDARTAAARRAAADAEARMRSTAVQRCLPRPCKGDVSRASCVAASSFDHSGANFDAVHAVVAAEMRVMILNDARAHPVPGTTCIYEEVKNFTKFTESQMLQARALVEAECKMLPPVDHETFAAAHAATQKRLMFLPGKAALADAASMAAADALAARKWEFDSLVAQAAEASRRAEATEKKVSVLTAGFMKRAASLATQANGLADAAYDKSLLLETYTLLREAEQQVLPMRMQELQERLAALQAKESEYQARYSELARAVAAQ